MTRVFNRMTAKLPPVAVRAEGLHIWDSDRKSTRLNSSHT